jgi:hypothetical protein
LTIDKIFPSEHLLVTRFTIRELIGYWNILLPDVTANYTFLQNAMVRVSNHIYRVDLSKRGTEFSGSSGTIGNCVNDKKNPSDNAMLMSYANLPELFLSNSFLL